MQQITMMPAELLTILLASWQNIARISILNGKDWLLKLMLLITSKEREDISVNRFFFSVMACGDGRHQVETEEGSWLSG